MKDNTLQSLYFTLFMFLCMCTLMGFAAGLADAGIIDLDYLDQEIENDNPWVIWSVFIIFFILPMITGHILAVFMMEQRKKQVE